MHGAGNDYIFFDCINQSLDFKASEISPILCDREKGIGGDGIILIGKSNLGDCSMDIYNADGSRARMCGNGVRCVAQYYQQTYSPNSKEIVVETLSGLKKVHILSNDGIRAISSVDMGFVCEPIEMKTYLDCLNETLTYYLVNTGNKHAVCFAENLVPDKFSHISEELQRKHNGEVNVEFIKKRDNEIYARVFERGSGETMACGTGATAIARVVNKVENKLDGDYNIKFPGGMLKVNIGLNKRATLTGESVLAYVEELNPKNIQTFKL